MMRITSSAQHAAPAHADALKPILGVAMLGIIRLEHEGARSKQISGVAERDPVRSRVASCLCRIPFEAHESKYTLGA